MTREERELSITYLEGIKEKYIEGEGYERHPLPEYYAIEMSIKALKQESGIRNCSGCKYSKDNHNAGTEECHLCMWENQYTPTTKNDLGVDCISRKAVLDITWQDPSYADPLNVLTEVRDKVRKLPSVIPQKPKWIPVTEGLPEKDGLYLVSVKNDNLRRYSKTCWYSDKNWFARHDVVAWQPLPEPYEGGQEDGKA